MKIKTKQLLIKTSLAIALLGISSASNACLIFCGDKADAANSDKLDANASLNLTNTIQASLDQQNASQALKDLNIRMTSAFRNIETEIQSNQAAQALSESKALLDEVRIITGIDPKAKIQKSYLVSEKFPEGASSLSDLPQQMQERVILSLENYQGGLFMDILNLTKRTTLLYIKSLALELKKSGNLLEEDRTKIISDIVKVSVLPVYIMDKTGVKIVAFSEDIANDDHIYLFNRDLKILLLSMNDLSISEDAFDSLKNDMKIKLRPVRKSKDEGLIFQSPDYLSCVSFLSATGFYIMNSTANPDYICTKLFSQTNVAKYFGNMKFQTCYNHYSKTWNRRSSFDQCEKYAMTKE